MKTIQYKKYFLITDNIFDYIKKSPKEIDIIIPHVCGSKGKFNSGFANALAEIYPEVKINYEMLPSHKLGEIQVISVDRNKVVINMICDNENSPKNSRLINYFCLAKCMAGVKSYIRANHNSEVKQCQIHAPKFGIGRSGGDWNFISELINDIWFDIETYIHTQKREV